MEAAAYFCCLEAVNNAIKHNDRSIPIRVTLRRTADQGLSFEVADDGQGFDIDATHAGAGLSNMADRVDAIGGALTLTSRPGAGTYVQGSVPSAECRWSLAQHRPFWGHTSRKRTCRVRPLRP